MFGMHILALIFCISGTGAVIGAVTSNEWKVTSRATSVITATWVFQGLWMNCAGNALGSYHCRPHLTLFRLEGFVQACRALMIAAICLGFFGSLCAFMGMKCTKIGGSDVTKAKIACLAGLFFILSGLCSLTACSLYAHKTTSEFFDPSVPQKYELGIALFIGWAGAALCLVGGTIFCCTIFAESNFQYRTAYSHAASTTMTSRPRTTAPYQMTSSRSSKEFNKTAYV
uniref:Claudin n=1 Tax=Leptobrachium leishanense TaxID=445787 RepID=A0A8C5LW69_9ANUR